VSDLDASARLRELLGHGVYLAAVGVEVRGRWTITPWIMRGTFGRDRCERALLTGVTLT